MPRDMIMESKIEFFKEELFQIYMTIKRDLSKNESHKANVIETLINLVNPDLGHHAEFEKDVLIFRKLKKGVVLAGFEAVYGFYMTLRRENLWSEFWTALVNINLNQPFEAGNCVLSFRKSGHNAKKRASLNRDLGNKQRKSGVIFNQNMSSKKGHKDRADLGLIQMEGLEDKLFDKVDDDKHENLFKIRNSSDSYKKKSFQLYNQNETRNYFQLWNSFWEPFYKTNKAIFVKSKADIERDLAKIALSEIFNGKSVRKSLDIGCLVNFFGILNLVYEFACNLKNGETGMAEFHNSQEIFTLRNSNQMVYMQTESEPVIGNSAEDSHPSRFGGRPLVTKESNEMKPLSCHDDLLLAIQVAEQMQSADLEDSLENANTQSNSSVIHPESVALRPVESIEISRFDAQASALKNSTRELLVLSDQILGVLQVSGVKISEFVLLKLDFFVSEFLEDPKRFVTDVADWLLLTTFEKFDIPLRNKISEIPVELDDFCGLKFMHHSLYEAWFLSEFILLYRLVIFNVSKDFISILDVIQYFENVVGLKEGNDNKTSNKWEHYFVQWKNENLDERGQIRTQKSSHFIMSQVKRFEERVDLASVDGGLEQPDSQKTLFLRNFFVEKGVLEFEDGDNGGEMFGLWKGQMKGFHIVRSGVNALDLNLDLDLGYETERSRLKFKVLKENMKERENAKGKSVYNRISAGISVFLNIR